MPNTTYGTPFVASSDLVSAYPGVSSNLATRLDQVSYAGNGLNNQTGTSYTLVLTDVGKTITLSNASAVSVTIPANASVAAPVGSMVRFCNLGAGTVTISPTGGVTLNGGNLSLAQFQAVQIVKLATDTWGVVESTNQPSGLNPVTPTSIANTGGTASLSGSAVTFSGCSAISLNGIFTATYATYFISVLFDASTGATYGSRLRSAGTDATGANYSFGGAFGGPSVGNNSLTSATAWNVNTTSAAQTHAWMLTLWQPAVADETTIYLNYTDNRPLGAMGGGQHNLATAYDGWSLITSAGTFAGTIRCYGYRA